MRGIGAAVKDAEVQDYLVNNMIKCKFIVERDPLWSSLYKTLIIYVKVTLR